MVLPNGLLAFYYGWKRRADILYASQVGDGHICIPLSLGLVALYRPMAVPAFFGLGISIIIGTTLVHSPMDSRVSALFSSRQLSPLLVPSSSVSLPQNVRIPANNCPELRNKYSGE